MVLTGRKRKQNGMIWTVGFGRFLQVFDFNHLSTHNPLWYLWYHESHCLSAPIARGQTEHFDKFALVCLMSLFLASIPVHYLNTLFCAESSATIHFKTSILRAKNRSLSFSSWPSTYPLARRYGAQRSSLVTLHPSMFWLSNVNTHISWNTFSSVSNPFKGKIRVTPLGF